MPMRSQAQWPNSGWSLASKAKLEVCNLKQQRFWYSVEACWWWRWWFERQHQCRNKSLRTLQASCGQKVVLGACGASFSMGNLVTLARPHFLSCALTCSHWLPDYPSFVQVRCLSFQYRFDWFLCKVFDKSEQDVAKQGKKCFQPKPFLFGCRIGPEIDTVTWGDCSRSPRTAGSEAGNWIYDPDGMTIWGTISQHAKMSHQSSEVVIRGSRLTARKALKSGMKDGSKRAGDPLRLCSV